LLADGDDAVVIIINLDGNIAFSQRGCEVQIAAGEAIPLLHAEPAEMRCSHVSYMSVVVPHRIAAASIREVEATAMLRIPSDTEALRLLVDYVRLLQKNMPIDMPEVAHSVASHIHDLFALTIGATRDVAELAIERGLRAARLLAIKADIQRNMADPGFRLTAVAKRAGLSPRTVQMLFETEGTSFSHYVLESRLARAYRELTAPRDPHRTIADIAYDAGFGDLSYFNRTFRRRYGASPSEIRSEARWEFK
jgi:AraC-like DNA-binding protein